MNRQPHSVFGGTNALLCRLKMLCGHVNVLKKSSLHFPGQVQRLDQSNYSSLLTSHVIHTNPFSVKVEGGRGSCNVISWACLPYTNPIWPSEVYAAPSVVTPEGGDGDGEGGAMVRSLGRCQENVIHSHERVNKSLARSSSAFLQ